jgi:hypothetical protein
MDEHPEIVDANFSKLSLLDESTYFAMVPWNREMTIRLFIHADGEDLRQCLERAQAVFSSVRKNEIGLVRKGFDEAGFANDWIDEFLYNEALDVSIEIFPNGEGELCYSVHFLGNLIIRFSRDAVFVGAWGAPC